MSRNSAHPHTSGAALAFAAAGAMLLGGCSSRDAEMSEKLAAMNAAATRAEAAATRAEQAAHSASSAPAPQSAEAEIDPEDDGTRNEPATQDPNSPAFNNTVG